jgi:hypothetical protein
MKLPSLARLLALGAGTLDFSTGLGLVFFPFALLPLMRVSVPSEEALVYLRFVGAFVAAVGASYLWAWSRRGMHDLRAMFAFTIFFRLSAGSFSAVAIACGWLSTAWLSVPVTDFALVAVQLWLLRRPIWSDENHL